MSEKSRLQIHTRIVPLDAEPSRADPPANGGRGKQLLRKLARVRRLRSPIKRAKRPRVRPAVAEKGSQGPKSRSNAAVRWKSVPHPAVKRKLFSRLGGHFAIGDRLLRDTAIACALLLGILAMRNADLPWTRSLSAGIERAVTMKIDLDESLGRLYFVRELVPETALVFWNAGSSAMRAPVAGAVEHGYSEEQPWVTYTCAGGTEVTAAFDGEVKAVEQGTGAEYIVLVTHDNGLQGVYAYMADVCVDTGDALYAGDALGYTASGDVSRLYFALRLGEEPVDPAEYM